MTISAISYGLASFVYFVFFFILLTDKHNGNAKILLLLATSTSGVWSALVTVESGLVGYSEYIDYLSIVKNAVWIAFVINMLAVLKSRSGEVVITNVAFKSVGFIVLTIAVILVLFTSMSATKSSSIHFYPIHLLLSIVGIVLVEQLYRNVSSEQRWIIKYLCLGLLGGFLYEFYLYSDALLYQRIDNVLLQTRGFVYALLVPLIAYSVKRDPLWSPEIFISRRVVFHTTALLASAIYLFIMGIVGYYVKVYGGHWGAVIQAFLFCTTIIILAIFLSSRRIRAKLKVFLNKHFYPYKYDYREEWLRLIKTISSSTARLYQESIRAIAQIIESPAGLLWINTGHGYYECVAGLDIDLVNEKEPTASMLPKFMRENEFVINVDEFKTNPEVYSRLGELELPNWIYDRNIWLIVPLIHIESLIGFVALEHSVGSKEHFNWEDSDLLKTAARQVASYISQQKISIALAEAKQFERFNKISTYIVHDMKNLVTQLSLIVANADKHRENPLFMKDVIRTVDNTAHKMNKMLDVVSNQSTETQSHRFNIIELLGDLVDMRRKSQNLPVPELECASSDTYIRADRDQLMSIFGHLIQNAQDATSDVGCVDIIQSLNSNGDIVIRFIDTGCGMTEDFIKDHLFRPFKSTKGKGMGIGVYETREIISALGGSIDVISEVGKGTTFTVTLPIALQ